MALTRATSTIDVYPYTTGLAPGPHTVHDFTSNPPAGGVAVGDELFIAIANYHLISTTYSMSVPGYTLDAGTPVDNASGGIGTNHRRMRLYRRVATGTGDLPAITITATGTPGTFEWASTAVMFRYRGGTFTFDDSGSVGGSLPTNSASIGNDNDTIVIAGAYRVGTDETTSILHTANSFTVFAELVATLMKIGISDRQLPTAGTVSLPRWWTDTGSNPTTELRNFWARYTVIPPLTVGGWSLGRLQFGARQGGFS